MNRRSFVVTGIAALVSSPVAVRAQGLVICRQCGREAKPGETVCSHCGAALAKPHVAEAAAPVVTAPDKGAEVVRMALGVIEGSLRQARATEEKQPEVALWHFHNALALMRLIPAGKQPATVLGTTPPRTTVHISKPTSIPRCTASRAPPSCAIRSRCRTAPRSRKCCCA